MDEPEIPFREERAAIGLVRGHRLGTTWGRCDRGRARPLPGYAGVMEQHDLIAKLLRIEALHAGATTHGEQAAAANARERILERLARIQREDPPIEMRFTLPDPWTRRLFLALARRYGLKPYREYRQRRQTVMLLVSRRFCDETLWPEFQALSLELRTYLAGITDRVIAEAIHGDATEAEEIRAIAEAK